MKYLLIFFFIAGNILGQEVNPKLYVWDYSGIHIYKEASLESKVLFKVEFNKPLELLSTFTEKTTVKNISNGLNLNGYWIKIKYGDIVGFTLSSGLSNRNGIKKDPYGRYEINTSQLLGGKKDSIKNKKTVDIKGVSYELSEEIITYEHGSCTLTYFDGCLDITYSFQELTFEQVYHLMIATYTSEMETIDGTWIEVPELIEKIDNIYTFSGTEATVEIQIRLLGDTIELFSYACT